MSPCRAIISENKGIHNTDYLDGWNKNPYICLKIRRLRINAKVWLHWYFYLFLPFLFILETRLACATSSRCLNRKQVALKHFTTC